MWSNNRSAASAEGAAKAAASNIDKRRVGVMAWIPREASRQGRPGLRTGWYSIRAHSRAHTAGAAGVSDFLCVRRFSSESLSACQRESVFVDYRELVHRRLPLAGGAAPFGG